MFQDRLKRFALKFFPQQLLSGMKKIHYIRALRSATEDREPDLRVVRYLVRAGETAVDVGANFGIYTAALAHSVGPSGRVISVEPVPATYELLASNVRKLGLTNVEGFNLAISGSDGSAWMEVPRYHSGGENFYEARIITARVESPFQTLEVPARTLDSLIGGQREVDFVKCDVEGHERECLRGAVGLLARCSPAWLLEVSGNPDQRLSPAAGVFETMLGHGYRPFWFDGQFLHARQRGDRSTNYFFLQRRHLERIPVEFFAEEAAQRRVA